MKVVGVIPARFGSTRFPGKPLHNIAGKALLEWVIEGVQKSRKLSDVIVATDHEGIFELAQKKGAKAVMTDSDLPSGSDRVWQAIQDIECDAVINIQGDEPLIQASMIDSLADCLLTSEDSQMATLGAPLKFDELESANVVKLLVNQLNEAIYFSRFAIPFSRGTAKANLGEASCVYKHIGMYAYKKDFLKKFCVTPPTWLEQMESLEQLRAMWLGAKIKVLVGQFECIGVDTPEDAIKVEKWVLERKGSQN
jgi:3-deoxy-manno-octulosonate cytidylyltransferase (CMP-KDO synthetase)